MNFYYRHCIIYDVTDQWQALTGYLARVVWMHEIVTIAFAILLLNSNVMVAGNFHDIIVFIFRTKQVEYVN